MISRPGLLIRPRARLRHNLLPYSAAFESWTNSHGPLTPGALAGPVAAAALMVDDALGTPHMVYENATIPAGAVTFSIYFKSKDRKRILIREGTTTGAAASFDGSTGQVIPSQAGGSGAISAAAGGFDRASMTCTLAAGSHLWSVYILQDTGSSYADVTFVGTGIGLYICGAQLTPGSIALPYVGTGASPR